MEKGLIMEIGFAELEVASPSVVKQAAQDVALALKQTPEYQLLECAAAALNADAEAQQAIESYRAKQQALQMMLQLNAVSPEDRMELNRLYQAFALRKNVQEYTTAEAAFRSLCQVAGDYLSNRIGFDFAAASSSGCC